MKILLVGSASIHTYRYLKGIAPWVSEIHLVSSAAAPEDCMRLPNLKSVEIVNFSWKSVKTAKIIRALIEKIQPDLVHVHQANSVAYHVRKACQPNHTPYVLTAWGSDVLLLPQKNRLLKSVVTKNIQAAKGITCDSMDMAAKMRMLTPIQKMKVLNFGMDVLPSLPQVKHKPFEVLSCRLHKPLYRVDAILRAWAEVEAHTSLHAWTLTVAAEGAQTPVLKALAQQLNLKRVSFIGFVDAKTLQACYMRARVMVSVPESDGTSISLLESLAQGCLPILSNIPANHEWVIDGLNGHIVENIDALGTSLIQGLLQAKEDDQLQKIAQLNHQLMQKKAVHNDNMQHFYRYYQEILTA